MSTMLAITKHGVCALMLLFCVNYIVHKTQVKHETRVIPYFTFEITSESWLKNSINPEREMTWFAIAQMNNTVGLALCSYRRVFGDFRY